MPVSYLWAVGNQGKVYRLSVTSAQWEETQRKWHHVRGFKKISAVGDCAWAIGSDHQPYIFIHSSDVPIRYREVTYENERWNPISGFSGKRLLPTDRWHYSTEDGRHHTAKYDVALPSSAWDWEDDWVIDENLKGEITDKGGWQYARKFNGNYTPYRKWNSLVRRRKWIRYRRYIATDAWAKVPWPTIGLDPTLEPFIDIAVGGYDLPNQPKGYLCVWAVTLTGKVVVRLGISRDVPEGIEWANVPTLENGQEVTSISVGPTGLLWAITYDGHALVRVGTTWEVPLGMSWVEVEPPEGSRLSQVAVGTGVVWAVTREGKVWFRKGIKPCETSELESATTGVTWIEMVGEMGMISVGHHDQVWAIGLENRHIFYRTGVIPDDLSGKTWKRILLPRIMGHAKITSSSESEREPVVEPVAAVTWDGDVLEGPCAPEDPALTPVVRTRTTSESVVPSHTLLNPLEGKPLKYDSICDSGINHGELCPYSDNLKLDCDNLTSNNINTNEADVIDNQTTRLPGQIRLSLELDIEVLPGCSGDHDSAFHCTDKENGAFDNSPGETANGVNTGMTSSQQSDIVNEVVLRAKMEALSKLKLSDNSVDSVSLDKLAGHRRLTRELSFNSDTSETIIDFTQGEEEDDDVITSIPATKLTPSRRIDKTKGVSKRSSRSVSVGDMQATKNLLISGDFRCVSFSTNPPLMEFPETLPLSYAFKDESEKYRYHKHQMTKSKSVPENLQVGNFEVGLQTEIVTSYKYDDDFTYDVEVDDTCWVWVSGSGCRMDSVATVPWFSKVEKNSSLSKEDLVWRNKVLNQLKGRNRKEVVNDPKYNLAVEKSSWMKKGTMQWWREEKRPKWTEVSVELEQGLENSEGFFTIHYSYKKQQKFIQENLSDIVAVWTVNDPTHKPVFGIYTPTRIANRLPIKLLARTEEELEDWITVLSLACCDLRSVNRAPGPRGLWSTTARGDVFVHEISPVIDTAPINQIYWHQLGGHLHIVETSPSGIVWAIGYNNIAWVYTGGYGGGIFKGLASSATGIHQQVDIRQMFIYENQRWNPVTGYSYKGLAFDRKVWSDKSGRYEYSKETFKLPSTHWQWTSDWKIDYQTPGGTDKEGWQYSRDFNMDLHGQRAWNDYIRRRRWVRECKVVTTGPWLECGPIPIQDMSIQVDAWSTDEDSPVAVWAISANGDVLCRKGVTKNLPQGSQWQHIPTDLPFQSISVGGSYRVWAVANDGSPWFRNRVTKDIPGGTCWFHVTMPPNGFLLKQISAGKAAVWAVDTKNQLWYRQNITSTYPEGTDWLHVSNSIKQVSVGPEDQVWVIADVVPCKIGPIQGMVCKRLAITDENPRGTLWDQGIGGGWQHICARGCLNDLTEGDYAEDVAAILPRDDSDQWALTDKTSMVC